MIHKQREAVVFASLEKLSLFSPLLRFFLALGTSAVRALSSPAGEIGVSPSAEGDKGRCPFETCKL